MAAKRMISSDEARAKRARPNDAPFGTGARAPAPAPLAAPPSTPPGASEAERSSPRAIAAGGRALAPAALGLPRSPRGASFLLPSGRRAPPLPPHIAAAVRARLSLTELCIAPAAAPPPQHLRCSTRRCVAAPAAKEPTWGRRQAWLCAAIGREHT